MPSGIIGLFFRAVIFPLSYQLFKFGSSAARD